MIMMTPIAYTTTGCQVFVSLFRNTNNASKGLWALLSGVIPRSLKRVENGANIDSTPNAQILLRRYPVMMKSKIGGIF